VVNDGCVALNDAIHVEVAPKASIGDFLVLERFDGGLDSFSSGRTSPEELYSHPGGPIVVSACLIATSASLVCHSLAAGLEVDLLIRNAVISRPGMDEDSGYWFRIAPKHPINSSICFVRE
jgi:hypothetical protein